MAYIDIKIFPCRVICATCRIEANRNTFLVKVLDYQLFEGVAFYISVVEKLVRMGGS